MEDEIRELYKAKVLEPKDFQSAMLLIKQELSRLEQEEKKCNNRHEFKNY